jgi:septal ring factor EnvC (AmiA/AmiB activator)
MPKKKSITLDQLARITQRGFLGVDRRFEAMDRKADGVVGELVALRTETQQRFEILASTLQKIQTAIEHLYRNHGATETDVSLLEKRVARLERQLRIH